MSDKPCLAVDLGGTKILTALVSPRGEVIIRNLIPTNAQTGPDNVIARIISSLEQVLRQASLTTAGIQKIGLAIAGPLDIGRGIVTTSPHLPGWNNVPLREIIQNKFGVPTFIIHDASAAALAEHRYGAGKGSRDMIYVTVSTGIGGGIIIGGKLYVGTSGTAGEVGHMTIEVDGPRCTCGNRGCWEMLASGTALAREAKKRITNGAQSSILALASGDVNNITAKTVSDAAENADSLALELVEQLGMYLGVGLANLINIFNPDIIIIGGGLSKMGNLLLAPAYRTVAERAFSISVEKASIVLSKLGDDAGVIGAASYMQDHIIGK